MDIDLPELNIVPKNSVSSPFSIANIIWLEASSAESLQVWCGHPQERKKVLKKGWPLRGSFDSDLPPDTLISHDYGNWPLNRGWHLNRGSAVMANASRQVSSFLCVRLSTEAGKTILALRTYIPLKTRSHLASSWVGWIYQDCLQTDNEPYEGDHKPADEQTVDTAQHFASSSNTAGPCFHSCKHKTCTAEECLISIDKLVNTEPWDCRK